MKPIQKTTILNENEKPREEKCLKLEETERESPNHFQNNVINQYNQCLSLFSHTSLNINKNPDNSANSPNNLINGKQNVHQNNSNQIDKSNIQYQDKELSNKINLSNVNPFQEEKSHNLKHEISCEYSFCNISPNQLSKENQEEEYVNHNPISSNFLTTEYLTFGLERNTNERKVDTFKNDQRIKNDSENHFFANKKRHSNNNSSVFEYEFPSINDEISERSEGNYMQIQNESANAHLNQKRKRNITIRKLKRKLRKWHFITETYFRIHSQTIKFNVKDCAALINLKLSTVYRYKDVIQKYFMLPILRKRISISQCLEMNVYAFERKITEVLKECNSQEQSSTSNSLDAEIDIDGMKNYYNFLDLPSENHLSN